MASAYSLHIHQRKAVPSFPPAVNEVVGDSRENAMSSYFLVHGFVTSCSENSTR